MTLAAMPSALLPHPRWRLDEDGELEKQCTCCGDWWPADKDFFHGAIKERGGLHCWCRACATEQRQISRRREAALRGPRPQTIQRGLRGAGGRFVGRQLCPGVSIRATP